MKSYTIVKFLFLVLILSTSYSHNYAQWVQAGTDIDGEAAGDQAGTSVSISSDGSMAAIGAPDNDGSGLDAGHVRVYENISGIWTQIGQDIDGEAAGDRSGFSVSLNADGSAVAIGAEWNDGMGTDAGHVSVYENLSGTWFQIGQDIDGEAAGDASGYSVSLNSLGNIVAIGARHNAGNGTNAGHVRVYQNMSGIWVQIGPDIDGEALGDFSGQSVSLNSSGSIVAIGAPDNDGNGSASGHVRVYENQAGFWVQIGQDIDGEAAQDGSGCSVSLNAGGNIVAIGADWNDGSGLDAGHVRVYENISGTWTQIGQDIDGEAVGDASGYSVSLNSLGNIVAIGARHNAGNGTNAGHVRVYENISGTWTQFGQDIDGEAADDWSGCSVDISSDGSMAAIGAYMNGGNGLMAGHARIFQFCIDPEIPLLSADSPICNGTGSTINITGNLNDATEWYIYTSSCGGTLHGTTSSITYTVYPTSTTSYYIRGEGGCVTPGSCASVTVTVEGPTTADAGSDQDVCSTEATLDGNVPSLGTGAWSLISGSGNITNTADPNTTVTGLVYGANMFRWTISDGTCPASTDDVIITAYEDPTTAFTGPDHDVCGTDAALTANSPSVGSGRWSLISGSGMILNSVEPITTVSGLAYGTNSFRWTIVSGTCPPSTDDMVITAYQVPTTADAGPDQEVCGTDAVMEANTPMVGIGSWSVISGSGTFADAIDPSTAVTEIGYGTNFFRWEIINGTICISSDDVMITAYGTPTTANAGPDQDICGTNATLAANAPIVGIGLWSLVSGTGNISNSNDHNTTVTSLAYGTNTFRWSIMNGVCPYSNDEVDIAAYELIVADAGADQGITADYTTLYGNDPAPGTGLWTLISGSGDITDPSLYNTEVTNLEPGTNIFRWTIVNGDCFSEDDVSITLSVSVEKLSELGISIYPNPSNGLFILKGDNIKCLRLFDITGEVLKEQNIENECIELDLSDKPKGVYLIEIQLADQIVYSKIIIK